MKHTYKLTGFDGQKLPDVVADNWYREGDFTVFYDGTGKEVARYPVLELALILTTAT